MRWGRAYFGAQAGAGAVWWILVAIAPPVRVATLGSLDVGLVALLDIPLFVVASAVAALGAKWAAYLATGWTIVVTGLLGVWATVTTEAGWGVVAMIAASTGSLGALALIVRGRIPTEWLVTGPFRFRGATAGRRPGSHVLATAAQIVVFWGGALVVIPLVIVAFESRWQLSLDAPSSVRIVGAVLLVLCSALGIWSAHAMSTKGDGTPLPIATANLLVVSGPYRFVRNPMAIAGIGQGVAVGLLLSSWLVVLYALLGSLVWNWAIRPQEEHDLEIRFGAAFAAYRDAVRCWVPRIPSPLPHASPSTAGEARDGEHAQRIGRKTRLPTEAQPSAAPGSAT